MTNKKNLIIAALVLVFLLGAGTAAYYFYRKANRKEYSAQELYDRGFIALNNDNPLSAYTHFAAAAQKDPKNPDFSWMAAKLAIVVQKPIPAAEFAKAAWDNGKKEPDVLLTILGLASTPKAEKLEDGLKMAEEITDEVKKQEILAKLRLDFGKPEDGLTILQEMFAQNPKPEYVGAIAQNMLKLSRAADAEKFLDECRDKGLLNIQGYFLLTRLKGLLFKLGEVDALFAEVEEKGMLNDALQFNWGVIRTGSLKGKLAKGNFEKLINPNRIMRAEVKNIQAICTKMFSGEGNAAKLPELMKKEIVEELRHAAVEEKFDMDLYEKLTIQFNNILQENDLSTIFDTDSMSLSQNAKKLLADKDIPAAKRIELNRELLNAVLPEDFRHIEENKLPHQARLFMELLDFGLKDAESIKRLKDLAEGEKSWLEGERAFCDHLIGLLENENQEEAMAKLNSAERLLKDSPVLLMHKASLEAKNKDFSNAISDFQAIAKIDPLFGNSPLVQIQVAMCFGNDGKPEAALETLSRLHARKFMTKQTLEMFRELSLMANQPEKSKAAQAALEKLFKEDPNVQFRGGLMDLSSGNVDDAIATFEELKEKYPEQQGLEAARLTALLSKAKTKDDLELVLEEAQKQKEPSLEVKAVMARIYTRLGRVDEAINTYKDILSNDNINARIKLEYAMLLHSHNKVEDAEKIYREVNEKNPDDSISNLGLAAIALARKDVAGVKLHAGRMVESNFNGPQPHLLLCEASLLENRPDTAYEQAQKALAIDTNNVRARYFSALAANRLGRFDSALADIAVCEKLIPGNRGVMWQKALAMGGMKRYDESLALMDETEKAGGKVEEINPMRFRINLMAKNFDKAEAVLAEMKMTIPATEAALLSAQLMELKGDKPGAIKALEGALNDPRALISWAGLKVSLGQTDGIIEKVKERDIPGMLLGRLALQAEKSEKLELAREVYKLAIEKEPENPLLLNNYAWSAFRTKSADTEGMLAAITKAYEKVPNNANILDTYVAILNGSGKAAEAQKALEAHIDIVVKSKMLIYRQAEAYDLQGKTDEALEYYCKARDFYGKGNIPVSDKELAAKIAQLEKEVGK